MQQYLMRLIRSRTVRTAVLVTVLVAGMVAGYLSGVPSGPPVVMAACGAVPGNCLDGPPPNGSSMAGVVVYHATTDDPAALPDVEPNDTDTWLVTATHSTLPNIGVCACNDYTSSVTADVTWTGSSWSVSCSGCSSQGPIMSLAVCSEAGCLGEQSAHGTAYRLIARVAQTRPSMCGINAAHLTSVKFETTAVDDGRNLNDCTDVGDVSPDSQSWAATDYAFQCSLTCSSVTGPNIRIVY